MLDLVEKITMTKPKRDFFDHFYISLRHRYAFHTIGKAANSTVKYLLFKKELAGTHLKLPSVLLSSPFDSHCEITIMPSISTDPNARKSITIIVPDMTRAPVFNT